MAAPDARFQMAPGLLEGGDLNGCLPQLKYSLQLLALPVTAQVYLGDGGGGKMEPIARAFDDLHRAICAELRQQLTPEQASLLARIEGILVWQHREASGSVWSDAALRRSGEWRQLRKLAREALVEFGWTLDLPPGDAMIYQLVGVSGGL